MKKTFNAVCEFAVEHPVITGLVAASGVLVPVGIWIIHKLTK